MLTTATLHTSTRPVDSTGTPMLAGARHRVIAIGSRNR